MSDVRLSRTIRRFLNARDGNIAMMFGLFIIPILIGAGIAVDFQRAGQARIIMQQSADAGLLAAVRSKMMSPNLTTEEMKARALSFYNLNGGDKVDATLSNFEIIFDPDTETYTLDFDAGFDTSILQIAGKKQIDTHIVSQVKLGEPPYLEIVLALDNTGSMNSNGKIKTLRDSATAMAESLLTIPDAEVMIGLVPFAQYATLDAAHKGEDWVTPPAGVAAAAYQGCIGSRPYPLNTEDGDYDTSKVPGITGAACPDPILPMTRDLETLSAAIKGMDGNGYTYIPAGLIWAWRAISPGAPYDEGLGYAAIEAKNGFKAIILMTDGQNTKSPDYPTHNNNSEMTANDITKEICVNVKEKNILIYTIAFEVSDLTIKDLLEECATSSGHYYDATNAADLSAAFSSIAASLRDVSLSK